MGTMPALMGSSRGAGPSLFLPPRPRAAGIKRKRRERRFDSNTKQIIPPGMEQNKSEWSLTAVIPPREATACGPRPADPATLGRDRGLGGSSATRWGRCSPRPPCRQPAGGPNPLSQLGTPLLGWLLDELKSAPRQWSSHLGKGASDSPGGLVKAQIAGAPGWLSRLGVRLRLRP